MKLTMTRTLSTILVFSAATGFVSIPANAQDSDPVCQYVGTTNWNVRDSFNNYLLGGIANGDAYKYHGGLTVREGATEDGQKPPKIDWLVADGTSSSLTKTRASIAHNGGVHWQGHNGYSGDDESQVADNFILDLDFSNITVEVNGTTGRLLLDYRSREFIDTSTVGEFLEGTQEELAIITFDQIPNFTLKGFELTGQVELTESGRPIFGNFYGELDSKLAPISLQLSANGDCGVDGSLLPNPDLNPDPDPDPDPEPDPDPPTGSIDTSFFTTLVNDALSIFSFVAMAGITASIIAYIVRSVQAWI